MGLVDDWRLKQVNWWIFGKTFSGWIITIVVTGLVSAAIYALGACVCACVRACACVRVCVCACALLLLRQVQLLLPLPSCFCI